MSITKQRAGGWVCARTYARLIAGGSGRDRVVVAVKQLHGFAYFLGLKRAYCSQKTGGKISKMAS